MIVDLGSVEVATERVDLLLLHRRDLRLKCPLVQQLTVVALEQSKEELQRRLVVRERVQQRARVICLELKSILYPRRGM